MAFKIVKKLFLILALSLPISMNGASVNKVELGQVETIILGGLIWNTILAAPLFAAGKMCLNPKSAPKYLTSPCHMDTIGGKPFPYVHPLVSALALVVCTAFYKKFIMKQSS